MRARLPPPAAVVLSLLILGPAPCAAGSDGNDTSSGDFSADGFDMTSRSEVSSGSEMLPVSEKASDSEASSGINYDYVEEYDFESQISSYIIDDSVRVEQVVKPEENKTESENTTSKPKRKKKEKRRRGNKKKNPCGTNFKSFCIHGKCVYREDIKAVTCKCHPDYFGERCGEKYMKTHSLIDSDLSKLKLAAIAGFVSAVFFTVIAVVITIQLRKQNLRKCEGEAEEQKKLQQENAHALA